jgi:hypothetical protein
VFGIVAIFVSIPHSPIAASIFLDIFNIFLLLLQLFSGGGD